MKTDRSVSAPEFREFSFDRSIQRGIAAAGFERPRPVQAATLPAGLDGRDVLGLAQTGTGKTAAFVLPILQRLSESSRRGPRALIVAPTRELAIQIRDEAELLGKHCGFRIHAVYGGVDYIKQHKAFEDGVDILIGTPGRLIDYFKQGAYTLRNTEVFVADEADRMFDMGFIDDMRYLIRRMPQPTERTSFLYLSLIHI